MGDKSVIEWTDATWNPTVGCDRISPGCAKCYAKELHDKRHKAFLDGKDVAPQYAQPFEVLQMLDNRLDAPLRWKKPRRIFVNSVSDLFYGDENDRRRCEREGRPFNPVPDAFIAEVFGVVAVCGAREHGEPYSQGQFGAKWDKQRGRWYDWKGPHTFQVLTKRPARMMRLLTSSRFRELIAAAAYKWAADQRDAGYLAHQIGERREYGRCYEPGRMWPLSNVWLGPSIENQTMADHRFPIAADLGEAGWNVMVSMEPLLGPVTIPPRFLALGRLAWVIVGGESGPRARPFDVAWARSIVASCRAFGVPVFVKQMGANVVDSDLKYVGPGLPWPAQTRYRKQELLGVTLRDRAGREMSEWPDDLKVREWPDGAASAHERRA